MPSPEPRKMPLIYVASSWRCKYQPQAVQMLRAHDALEVYDFRAPAEGNNGFSWREIDGGWQSWTTQQYIAALTHPIAEAGFELDRAALDRAAAVVLVLPCGRSAHVEAAWAKGRGKPVWVWSPEPCEPELMYKLFDGITDSLGDILAWIARSDGVWGF